MGRVASAVYGVVVYLIFLATFLYLIGFVEGFVVPKTVDAGPSSPVGAAIAVDLVLVLLFGVQHSVMARRGFKDRWTKIVSPAIERSTFVLAASAVLALLLWQWRPIP